MMHVSMMVLSYAALLCGSLLSLALLVITFLKNIEIFGKINHLLIGNFHRYQLIHQLDYWSYRVISLGFIFLTIGILSGAVWANEAWGTYWNWDPKETWAFITWTIFAIYYILEQKKNCKVQLLQLWLL
ncbi:hypothetical protein NE237_019548 [Protea cynaroides]|uniref:Cytochrome c assembly protein domain-containing protein n=1 Tax=Protea cynaroides TaxID=273540 RepID=A0A9Q0H4V9_9MAGN|nr:hypothetical protein NE237_019548 [Protea cynaroides]